MRDIVWSRINQFQIQEQTEMYKGTWDALRKIHASEGVSGFYRGFWVNSIQVSCIEKRALSGNEQWKREPVAQRRRFHRPALRVSISVLPLFSIQLVMGKAGQRPFIYLCVGPFLRPNVVHPRVRPSALKSSWLALIPSWLSLMPSWLDLEPGWVTLRPCWLGLRPVWGDRQTDRYLSFSQVFSGIFYISTYEGVRHLLARQFDVHDLVIRAFVGGLCASVVGQMITVPFDVVSQHMMLIGGDQNKGPKKLKIARWS